MVKEPQKLYDICRIGLPKYTEEHIPKLVFDFMWKYKDKIIEILTELKMVVK